MLEELLKEKTKELEDTRKELRSEKEAFIKMYNQYVQEKEEKERLNNIIEKLEQENAVLKTQVVNKDKYSYGIR